MFNILLQVLDDGHITDAQGRKIDFKNTIIIMTSNAGAAQIIEPKKLGFTTQEDVKADYNRMKERVLTELKQYFRPEFLNRIDETIVFHPLGKEDMKQITALLIKELQTRCKLQLGILLKVRESAKKYIAEKGFDAKFGARPLKRFIQSKVEDPLAEDILLGEIREGDTVEIGCKKGELVFEVKKAEV